MWNLDSIQFKIEEKKGNYGEYSFGPLESGYGLTLGTALRRILLASIEGVAPIGIAIEGVTHEFSTIEGTVEDVEEIILNVKKLVVALEGTDSAILSFDTNKEGEFKAKDLRHTSEVTILNPDLHIATVSSSKFHFKGEIYVKKGKGYKLEEEIAKTNNLPQTVIPIDAYFSPVLKVSFHVKPMRFEESVNYDRLIISILTKENKSPLDALREAVKILIDYSTQFSKLLSNNEKDIEDRSKLVKDMDIKELNLSKRASNILEKNGITTVGALLNYTDEELLKLGKFGKKSLEDVKSSLKKMNLNLNKAQRNKEV